jgi:hypothetical protein
VVDKAPVRWAPSFLHTSAIVSAPLKGAGMVIRRIGIGSIVNVAVVTYGLLGIVFGVCFALFATVFGAAAAANDDMPAWVGSIFGIGAIIILPIVYGVMGAIGGVLMGALYNLVAGMVGGLEVDVQ